MGPVCTPRLVGNSSACGAWRVVSQEMEWKMLLEDGGAPRREWRTWGESLSFNHIVVPESLKPPHQRTTPLLSPSTHVGGDRDGQTLTTQVPTLCLSWEGGAEVLMWVKSEVSIPWTKTLCFWTEICLVTSEGFERLLHERRKQENLRTGQASKGRCSRWNNLKGLEGNNSECGWDYTTCAACSMLGLQVENHQVRVPRTSLMRSVILQRLFLHRLVTERRAI